MEADFSGYATKAGLKCTDGRTIMPDAFAHQNTTKVPLVWKHGHDDPTNVLGHMMLETRDDGVYAYGFFNNTDKAIHIKETVQHGDLDSLSIWANGLVEKNKQVFHGQIREVSLVLAGANPGAKIDNVAVRHSDGEVDYLADEAIITTGLSLEEIPVEHAGNEDDLTVEDVFNSMTDEQKKATQYLVGAALADQEAELKQSQEDSNNLEHKEGAGMSRNIFETHGKTALKDKDGKELSMLSHDDMKEIVADAVKNGGKLSEAIDDYAIKHGIENIGVLFPDFKSISDRPEFNQRRTEWVASVMSAISHTPFARIKTLYADITEDDARAKGYITGHLKKEEFFKVAKRTTGPTTIYKKQKLDRDDIIDIIDFDVVAWMKMEMRMMLDEEIARAILIGDGREFDDEDKIKDPEGANDGLGIRSIVNDHELYTSRIYFNLDDGGSSNSELTDGILASRVLLKGTGTPTFFTTEALLTKLLLTRDTQGRRLYRTVSELASELRVDNIIPVEVMETEPDLLGVIVNLTDYTVGADKGGEVTLFDDFDIDYNQYKYLIETRISGALKKLKSAIAVYKTAAVNVLVTPTKPAFNQATNTITIPTQTGVSYKINGVSKSAGSNTVITADAVVEATAAAGYYFANSDVDDWTFDFKPTS